MPCAQALASPTHWTGPSQRTRVTKLGCAVPQVVTIFSLVEVVLQAETAALKYSALLKRPGTNGLLGLQNKEEPDAGGPEA